MVLNTERAVNNYRFERKFSVPELTIHEIDDFVMKHPALFREIFHRRYVNNIYFDSVELKNYYDSIHGSSYRMKIRIRWYGELFGDIINPILELKIKDGIVNKKLSFPLKQFTLDKNFSTKEIKGILLGSEIPAEIKYRFDYVFPVLLNRYQRKYFQSCDQKFRLTLDNDLSFYRINALFNRFVNNHVDKQNIILELKYDHMFETAAERITNAFPFRLFRSSKYVTGVEKLNM